MAVQKVKRKSGFKYRAYWRNPVTGKLEYGAWTTKKEAERESDEIAFRLKHDRDSFEAPRPASTDPTFAFLAEEYLGRKLKREVTRKMTFYHLKTIIPFIGGMPATHIGKADMKRMASAFEAQGLKQNTIHTRITLVRTILNWAAEEEMIIGHNLLFFRVRRGSDEQIPPPTPEEVRRLRDVAAPHLVRCILLGFYLGLRFGASELLRLRWEDVDFTRGKVRAQSAKKNEGMQWRELDIHADLMPHLLRWWAEDQPKGISWLVSWQGKPITTPKTAWRTALRKAGITRRIRPYDLRHAFATEMIAAGADAKTAAGLMGHSTTAMVHKHYQHVLDRQRKAAITNLPSLDEQPENGIQERHTNDPSNAHFLYADRDKIQ